VRLYEAFGDEVELLLSNAVLSGESGRTLATRLQRQNPWLKILLITGYAEQMGPRDTLQEECLAQPFFYGSVAGKRQAIAGSRGIADWM
jgi:hypothetical protein